MDQSRLDALDHDIKTNPQKYKPAGEWLDEFTREKNWRKRQRPKIQEYRQREKEVAEEAAQKGPDSSLNEYLATIRETGTRLEKEPPTETQLLADAWEAACKESERDPYKVLLIVWLLTTDTLGIDTPGITRWEERLRDGGPFLPKGPLNMGETRHIGRDFILNNKNAEVAFRWAFRRARVSSRVRQVDPAAKGSRGGRRRKYSDEDCRKYEATFDEFIRQGMEAKQAWAKTAKVHQLKSGDAARAAVYRWKQRQTPAK